MEIARKLFEALSDVGCDDALFLDVLGAPSQGFALTIELVTLELHRSSQSDGAPGVGLAFEENLRSSRQPAAALRRINKGDEHAGIKHTGPIEEIHRFHLLLHLLISTTGKDDLAESSKFEL